MRIFRRLRDRLFTCRASRRSRRSARRHPQHVLRRRKTPAGPEGLTGALARGPQGGTAAQQARSHS